MRVEGKNFNSHLVGVKGFEPSTPCSQKREKQGEL